MWFESAIKCGWTVYWEWGMGRQGRGRIVEAGEGMTRHGMRVV